MYARRLPAREMGYGRCLLLHCLLPCTLEKSLSRRLALLCCLSSILVTPIGLLQHLPYKLSDSNPEAVTGGIR